MCTQPLSHGRHVLLQGFHWGSARQSPLYKRIATTSKLSQYTAVWLPPPSRSVSDEGYLPLDWYDLDSRYGSMEELRQLNASLKATGIVPVVDLVLNHRCASSRDNRGRWSNYSTRPLWDSSVICCDQHNEYGGTGARKEGDLYQPAPNLDHCNSRVRADIKEWMAWLQHEMGFQGFRFDFVRGKFCTVTYGPRKQSLKLQTPAVYMPFGLSSFRDEATGLVTDSVEVSLRGWDDPSNSSMQQLYNVLQQIDEAVLQSAEQQSQELFGKPMGRGILQEFQRQLLKRRDEKFPPLWKSKAGVNMQGQLPRVYDVQDKTQAQELGYITKGTTAKLLVTMPSMYLISKSYGLSCRLVQVLVTHRPMQDEGCQLRDDDDDCNSHDDSTTTTTTAAIMVEEDDGDSDF